MTHKTTLPRQLRRFALCFGTVAALAHADSTTTDPARSSPKAVTTQYCVGCHNNKLKTAGVSVQALDPENVGTDAATWEKVLRKVRAGQMPPAGLPHPKPEVQAAYTKWLEQELDKSSEAHPNPGSPTIHRLNRAEYSNAIRDLLALDIKPGAKLPADDSGYGFDNIGDVLSLSPVLIERYISVGRMVSRLAIGDVHRKPETDEFDMPRGGGGRRSERISDDVPFDSTGGLALTYSFPVDAEYVFKLKFPGGDANGAPRNVEYRVPVKAGTRSVAATFLADNSVPEAVPTFGVRGIVPPIGGGGTGGAAPTTKLDLRLDGTRLKLFDAPGTRFTSLSISGPYEIAGPGNSPSRAKIFVCEPKSAKDEEPCARKILTGLSRMAYRRPVTEADTTPLMAMYRLGRKEGSFDSGIQMALEALLVSPNFLFRVERDPAGAAPGSVNRVSDLELASRLSFFLWSSIPDEQLLRLAETGKLRDQAVLHAQVARMLDDRRSNAFVSNFAGQWLFLRTLSQVRPDQDVFPKYDPSLRNAFERETEMFFDAVMRENRPVTDLLSANFTFLNQRLAEHYGIPNVYGSQFRRVTLDDPNRGGLLGQGSILTVTSYPNRTSVVQRGKWVLENLVGSPPPPPPPDIPALEAHAKDGKTLTMRQQMEQHRANPTCASCHSRMDPIGFSLEQYDGVGAFRTKDGGSVIDPTGKMPDGTTFQGPAGLRKLLVTSLKDQYLETFTEKLMTYALGRGVEYYDMPAVRRVVREAETHDASIPAFINAVIDSPQFQTRKARE